MEICKKIEEFLENLDGDGSGTECGAGYYRDGGAGSCQKYSYKYGLTYEYGFGSGAGGGDSKSSGSGEDKGPFSVGSNGRTYVPRCIGRNIKKFNGNKIYRVAGINAIITRIKRNVAKGYIVNVDFSLTSCYIIKSYGLFAYGETLQRARESLEKNFFDTLWHREIISEFIYEFGENKKYHAMDFYNWCCEQTRDCEGVIKVFLEEHEIDLEKDAMTVKEFIERIKNSHLERILDKLDIII